MRRTAALLAFAFILLAATPASAQHTRSYWPLDCDGTEACTIRSSSGYMNFGDDWGSAGYGIRVASGVLQVKNSGGTWARLSMDPLSSDGTNVTLQSGQHHGPVGNVGAPTYSYASDPTTGRYRLSAGVESFASGGVRSVSMGLGYIQIENGTTQDVILGSDLWLRRAAAGHLRVTTDGSTLGTLSSARFTTTGTGTVTGYTLADAEQIAVAGGGRIIFRSGTNDTGGQVQLYPVTDFTYTSGGIPAVGVTSAFTPGSGSGSNAAFSVLNTVNGTSSGTAYGLVVASKTNTLTGGTIKLLSLGTTTTDAFTGYSEKFSIDTSGNVTTGGILRTTYINNANNTDTVFQFTDSSPHVTMSVGATAPLLRFGGTDNTYPALKRTAAVLEVKLADDSAYTPILASAVRAGTAGPASGLGASFFSSGAPLASLGTPDNGHIVYCTDCTHGSNPCTGSSTGAVAKRLNGAWVCN